MHRFVIFLIFLITVVAFIMGYQHYSLKKNEAERQTFDLVMSEKMGQLYEQAQDWSKPIQLNVHDERLHGDYKVLSEFVLNYWVKNAETRNQYLRELKAVKWEHFLNVNRLDNDRKQAYKETESMLQTAHKASEKYLKQNELNKNEALVQVKKLDINRELRKPLEEKLEKNLKHHQESSLIMLEIQVFNKADEMLAMLKKYEWERKGDQILFKNDAQVKQFNALYQDILKLSEQIDQRKEGNADALEGAM